MVRREYREPPAPTVVPGSTSEKSETTEPKISFPVYIREDKKESSRQPLFGLARLFGMDVYGDNFLTEKARKEMGYAALLILIVTIFDFLAWSLLFNALLHPTSTHPFAFDWITLFGSLPLASLFSGAVFIYERQFFTTDVHDRKKLRLAVAIFLRLAVIGAAAVVTAQPIELLVFSGPIKKRVHEESIRSECARLYGKLQEQKKKKPYAILKLANQSSEASDLREAKQERKKLLVEQQRLATRLSIARSRYLQWRRKRRVCFRKKQKLRRKLARIPKMDWKRRNQPERDFFELSKRCKRATRFRDRYAAQRNNYGSQLAYTRTRLQIAEKTLSENRTAFQARRKELGERAEGLAKQAAVSLDKIRGWIKKISLESLDEDQQKKKVAQLEQSRQTYERCRQANFSNHKEKCSFAKANYDYQKKRMLGPFGEPFQFPVYDFFSRLRVLDDLYHGRPPRWPDIPQKMKTFLMEEFGLFGLAPERLREEANQYKFTYYVVYAIAFIIPLLLVAMKFLIASELTGYYSVEHQAKAENKEAKQFTEVNNNLFVRLPSQINPNTSRFILSLVGFLSASTCLNVLLHGRLMKFSTWSFGAAIGGILIALMLSSGESTLHQHRQELGGTVSTSLILFFIVLRVSLLGGAMYFVFDTTFIVFSQEKLEQRIQEEQLRQEAVDKYYLYFRQKNKKPRLTKGEQAQLARFKQGKFPELRPLLEQLASHQKQMNKLQRRYRRYLSKRWYRTAKRFSRRSIKPLQQLIDQLQQQQKVKIQSKVENLLKQTKKREMQAIQLRITQWLNQIHRYPNRLSFVEKPDKPSQTKTFRFERKVYTLAQKFRVASDMLRQQPLHWPPVTPAVKKTIQMRFGISDPSEQQQKKQAIELIQDKSEIRTTFYFVSILLGLLMMILLITYWYAQPLANKGQESKETS